MNELINLLKDYGILILIVLNSIVIFILPRDEKLFLAVAIAINFILMIMGVIELRGFISGMKDALP
ncbi:hypothetical protein FNX24_21615 [Salmonella enterica]|nr:hypothetical protein [Salmonella enterica]